MVPLSGADHVIGRSQTCERASDPSLGRIGAERTAGHRGAFTKS
jgi:hypothetical protein